MIQSMLAHAWAEPLAPVLLLMQVALIFFIVLCRRPRSPRGRRRRRDVRAQRHAQNQQSARRVLATLRDIGPRTNPGRLFGYLRKISPLVFEEAILSELADRGHRIERSASYSGDGGVDGVFEIDGRRWMIQAKRYGAHVSAAHVEMFARLCEAKDACGLFVHTGRTGRLAWSHERASGYVRIISGDDLVKLFAGEPIRLLRSRAEG